jgi:hypothetical protein
MNMEVCNMNESQLDIYKTKQDELVKKYDGEIIAFKDGVVLGTYPSKSEALHDMRIRQLAPGSFLIIRCTAGDEEYTRRYRSRVIVCQGFSVCHP